MKELKADIKSGRFKRACLLFGDEKYLVSHYERQIKNKLLPAGSEGMNLDLFEGKIEARKIISAALTVPFLHDRRLILVKRSHLFTAGRKADSELVADFLPEIPEHTVILFI